MQYQPLGVVGILTAWNFPGNMVFNGLAGALAAGNRVMIKVSEYNPKTSALLATDLPRGLCRRRSGDHHRRP